jgi:ElaB/YqjD/DUF883 family membrane-anchored ribosome-binding protein
METNENKDETRDWQGEVQEAAQHLQSEAESKMSDLTDTVRQWQRRATETSRKAAEATDDYVRENTWTVIASVAVATLLLGFFLGRSRD